jgi:hypothetical protein
MSGSEETTWGVECVECEKFGDEKWRPEKSYDEAAKAVEEHNLKTGHRAVVRGSDGRWGGRAADGYMIRREEDDS